MLGDGWVPPFSFQQMATSKLEKEGSQAMRTTRAAWAAMAAACLGFLALGCGGGSGDSIEDPSEFAQAPSPPPPGPEVEPSPPGEAAPPEETTPPDDATPPEEAALPGDAAPEDEPMPPEEPDEPAEAEESDDGDKASSEESGPGTDELLALAKTAATESKSGGSEGRGHDDYEMQDDPSMDAMMDESMGVGAYPGAEGFSEEMLGGAGLDLEGLGEMAGAEGGRDSKAKEPDFGSPPKAAETFLDALKNRDIRILAESTALRAQYEAETSRLREMFMALRSESLDPETLDDLAQAFDGMNVVGMNTRKSTGSAGVIVGKREGTKFQTRTLTIRHEKDGWKVMDFSGPRVQDMPRGRPGRGNPFRRRR